MKKALIIISMICMGGCISGEFLSIEDGIDNNILNKGDEFSEEYKIVGEKKLF